MSDIIENLNDISAPYNVLLCDLWGCVHNGVRPFSKAMLALKEWKYSGRIVIFLTNSPMPNFVIENSLKEMGIDKTFYDAIITSGDASREALQSGFYGEKIHHIGPSRDLDFFKNISVARVALEEADSIICTGLFKDASEKTDDYHTTLALAKERHLKMLCANPDVTVDRGNARIYCAGALAESYFEIGGEVYYYGKPHSPIYQLARQIAHEHLGYEVENEAILCVGDGIKTDVAGALMEGLDCVFVTGGLARQETKTYRHPNKVALEHYLTQAQLSARYSIGELR